MKKFLFYIPLLIFFNCSSSLDSIIKEQNRLYSKEQLKDDFLIHYLKYINNTRDTIFKESEVTGVKDFILIEYRNIVDWRYSGCFVSQDKTIGFEKEVMENIEYEECGLENYIEYLGNTSDEIIEECGKRNWSSGGGMIFFIKSEKGKITVRRFQDFDIEQCIKEQKIKKEKIE